MGQIIDSMKGFLASLLGKILVLLLLTSLATNVFLAYGKGITIDRSDRSDRSDRRVSHQEQMQGQLFIQNGIANGDKIRWECKSFATQKEVSDFITAIHPTSSLLCKISSREETVIENSPFPLLKTTKRSIVFDVWFPTFTYNKY